MKPIIAITPCYDIELESQWMLKEYVELIQAAGGIPLTITATTNKEDLESMMQLVDGILLTGGQDVNPKLYRQELHPTVTPCNIRDEIEIILFKYAYNHKMPILGICRGEQFINVMLGGTLIQDIPSSFNHIHRQSKPYNQPFHQNKIIKESPLYDLIQKEIINVNSLHHQAIDQLGNGLKPMAISTDHIIEAIYLPNYPFLWAVQWHPEYDYKVSNDDLKIVQAFIEASKHI